MRRSFVLVALVAALMVMGAAPAFAAHCINQSKPEGAGQLTTVVVDVTTGEATFVGANPAGKPVGGFADVYLDFDGDGTGDDRGQIATVHQSRPPWIDLSDHMDSRRGLEEVRIAPEGYALRR